MTLRARASRLLERYLDDRARPFSEEDLAGPAIVFAPHPDDETLGCGGAVRRMSLASSRVHIVVMTDGEGAPGGADDPDKLALERRQEVISAAERLGVSADHVVLLHLPDGSLDHHRERMTREVRAVLDSTDPAVVFTPYRFDWHPDHHATSRAVADALRDRAKPVVVYEYVVWFWYHWPWVDLGARTLREAFHATVRTVLSLALMWRDLRYGLDLEDALLAKRAAFQFHASQASLGAISSGAFLERLLRPKELYARRHRPHP